jgi:hypothetical protein
MIRYALACDGGHTFESWFPSASAYDEQAARGLVTCPACDSARVTKQIMAPSVARTDRTPPEERLAAQDVAGSAAESGEGDAGAAPGIAPGIAPLGPALPVPASQPVALMSDERRKLREAVAQLRAYVEAHAEDVGRRFADEARAIHEGDAPERFIMGQADRDEVAELLEDGIAVAPLPILPDERN